VLSLFFNVSSGAYRGPAHQNCNVNFQDSRTISVIFHYLTGYNMHFLVEDIATSFDGQVDLLALNMEKYYREQKFRNTTFARSSQQVGNARGVERGWEWAMRLVCWMSTFGAGEGKGGRGTVTSISAERRRVTLSALLNKRLSRAVIELFRIWPKTTIRWR